MARKVGWTLVILAVVLGIVAVLALRDTGQEAPPPATVPESTVPEEVVPEASPAPPAGESGLRDAGGFSPGGVSSGEQAPPASDEPFSPGGVVYMPDGSPAAGVPVSLHGVTTPPGGAPETEELRRTETGRDGRFSFPDLERGPHSLYAIEAEADGYTHAGQHVVDYRSMPGRIPPGPEWEDHRRGQVTIQLHHAAEVAGRIVYEDGEAAGGLVLAWAAQPGGSGETWTPYGRMAVLSQGSVFPTTGSDGTFRLEGLAAGTFALSASAAEGMVLKDWLLEAPASGLELTVPRPPEPNSLRGRVVNADTEQGQAGVEFTLRWAGPPPEPSRMATPPSPGEPNLDMLRSMVRSTPATISRLNREAATLRSGPGGEFELAGAIAGTYQLAIKEEGLYLLRIDTGAEGVRRMHGNQPFFVFDPDGGPVEIHVHEGRPLHGRVMLTEPDEPLEGQPVNLLLSGGSPESSGFRRSHVVVTDEEGRFRFEGVDVASVQMLELEGVDLARHMGGTSQVSTGGERYRGASIGDEAKLDGEEVLVRLRREAVARISVVHADGSPAYEAEVRLAGFTGVRDESPSWHRVDAEGRVELPVHMNTQYVVEARTMAPDAGAVAELRVPARGEVPEVRLRLGAPGRVAGRVVGPEGRAVPGATVLLYPREAHGSLRQTRQESTTTSADGRFQFEMVPKGQYGLNANADGGSLVTRDSPALEITDGDARTGIELRLVRKDFTLRGRVLDQEERPIEGVRVTVGPENTETGPDGRFTIEGLLPTVGYLQLQKEGYASTVGVQNYQPVEEEQVFTLGRLNQRRLIVQVLDGATGRPVEGLSVTRGHGYHLRDITITATGFEYEFQIQRGQVTILAAYLSAPGYPVTPHLFTLDGEEDPIVREVRLRRGETLTGRVVRFGADSPMEGVHVSVRPGPESHAGPGGAQHNVSMNQPGLPGIQSMRTDADGYFVFRDAPPTSGTIRIDAAAGPNQYLEVGYEFPERGPLDMGEIVLGERPELVVRLVALGSGEPIPGQEVAFQPSPRNDGLQFDRSRQNGTTDDAGRVSFGPQFALRGTIRTGAKQQQVELPDDGGVHEVLIELGQAAAGVRLTRDPAPGLSRPGVSANIENEHFQGSHQADSDGVRWVENLPGGEVQVRASFSFPTDPFAGGSAGSSSPFRQRNNYMARTWTLELAPTERRVLDLTPPAGTIEGRVELASGHDMEDVSVELQIRRTEGLRTNDWGGTRHVRPGADGTYRIEHVPPGEHTLSAEHPILGSDSRDIEMPEDGTLREDFALLTPERGTLVSIVFSAETGEPLPGAMLFISTLPRRDGASHAYPHPASHDGEGVLLVEGLEPGSHEGSIRAPGHGSARVEFEINAGETTYLETELEPVGAGRSESSGDPLAPLMRQGVRQ